MFVCKAFVLFPYIHALYPMKWNKISVSGETEMFHAFFLYIIKICCCKHLPSAKTDLKISLVSASINTVFLLFVINIYSNLTVNVTLKYQSKYCSWNCSVLPELVRRLSSHFLAMFRYLPLPTLAKLKF